MVSRALSGTSKFPVSAEKRQLILDAAKELGYRPNHAARTLATGLSHVVALQIYDMENPHQQRVAQRLSLLLKQESYDLIVHGYSTELIRDRWLIDGTIVLDMGDYPDVDLHSSVVGIGAFVSDKIDSVMVDLQAGAAEAMDHLLASGRRNIALVSKDVDNLADGRTVAYRQAVTTAGLKQRPVQLLEHHREDGWHALTAYLKAGEKPDALLCQNDQVAEGCYRALRDAGLTIPGDVAVVGCDGLDQNEYVYPALSTIEQPVDEMCATGWRFLHNRMADPSIPRQKAVLKSRYVDRNSS
jgi:LacI family transcriptional regulator